MQLRTGDDSLGITTIVCHDHINYFILSLKSFFYFSSLNLPTTVIDDGTLTHLDIDKIRSNFINITIIKANTAKKKIKRLLKKYRYSYRFRMEENSIISNYNKKLFDPILLSVYKRFIYIDSDILFYSKPKEIIQWSSDKNRTLFYMKYTDEHINTEQRWGKLTIKILSHVWHAPSALGFNSGIMCGNKTDFRLPIVESYMQRMYSFNLQRTWLCEQFVYSLLFSQLHKKHSIHMIGLPSDTYAVLTEKNTRDQLFNHVCVHYHGETKKYFPVDALKLLHNTNFFRSFRVKK